VYDKQIYVYLQLPVKRTPMGGKLFNMCSLEVRQRRSPNGFSSTCATFQPAFAHLAATTDPPEPVPITIRSKFFLLIQTNNKICFPEWADRHYPRRSRIRSSRRVRALIPHGIPGIPKRTGRHRWAFSRWFVYYNSDR